MVEGKLIIGFDIGTTSVKAGLFDMNGTVVDHWGRSYPTERPGGGLVEQDPQHWLDGVRDAIDALLVGRDPASISAVGLCSQVNTDVFVDAAGRPLAPAIVWQDVRAGAAAAAIDARITPQDKQAWWGAEMPIGASHVLAKMAWFAEHHPGLWEKTAYVFSPKDFCLFHLTGNAVADPIAAFGHVGLDHAYVTDLIARVPGAAERLPPLRAMTALAGRCGWARQTTKCPWSRARWMLGATSSVRVFFAPARACMSAAPARSWRWPAQTASGRQAS
jgi:xylulokinase